MTVGTQPVIYASERAINETMNTIESMNAATLNQDDALSFQKTAPVLLPNSRPVIEPQPGQRSDVNGKSPELGRPKKSNRRRNIIAGIATLVTGLVTGVYYF